MSSNNPIPVRLREEFFAHMDAHNDDDAPDGAWFALLEEAARDFIKRHRLKYADENSAVHQWIRHANKHEAATLAALEQADG